MGKKGTKRYSPKFQFQVVLEVLKGDREAEEIDRFLQATAELSAGKPSVTKPAEAIRRRGRVIPISSS